MEALAYILIFIIAILFIIFIRFYIAWKIAEKYKVDMPVLWGLISFFTSPVFVWIILFIIILSKGKDNNKDNV